MFERLHELVRGLSTRVTIAELRAFADMLDEIPGVSATRDGDRVVVEGRELTRRRIEDPRLRGVWR